MTNSLILCIRKSYPHCITTIAKQGTIVESKVYMNLTKAEIVEALNLKRLKRLRVMLRVQAFFGNAFEIYAR